MVHPYDYSMIVGYIKVTKISGAPDYSNPEDRKALTTELGKFARRLPKTLEALPDGEGWFPNSHNITLVGDTLILSMLLQRSHK